MKWFALTAYNDSNVYIILIMFVCDVLNISNENLLGNFCSTIIIFKGRGGGQRSLKKNALYCTHNVRLFSSYHVPEEFTLTQVEHIHLTEISVVNHNVCSVETEISDSSFIT